MNELSTIGNEFTVNDIKGGGGGCINVESINSKVDVDDDDDDDCEPKYGVDLPDDEHDVDVIEVELHDDDEHDSRFWFIIESWWSVTDDETSCFVKYLVFVFVLAVGIVVLEGEGWIGELTKTFEFGCIFDGMIIIVILLFASLPYNGGDDDQINDCGVIWWWWWYT